MNRRMEDRIRKLCAEVIAESNPERARELSRELRAELHDFIAELRARITAYPVVGERRAQANIPPAETARESDSETMSRGFLKDVAAAKAQVR